MTRNESVVIAEKLRDKIFDSFSEDGETVVLERESGWVDWIADEIYHADIESNKFIKKAVQQSELVVNKDGSHSILVPYWFCQKEV